MRAQTPDLPAICADAHHQIAAPRYRAMRFISLIRDM
jgi:hypothetical protein